MITYEEFSLTLLNPLIRIYGESKLPQSRAEEIYKRVKHMDKETLKAAYEKIAYKHDNFAGAQAIVEVCTNEFAPKRAIQVEKMQSEKEQCLKCKGQGVIQKRGQQDWHSNIAYKCSCPLGEMLFSGLPSI